MSRRNPPYAPPMPWPVAMRYHAAPTPIAAAPRMMPACRRLGRRFWTDTAGRDTTPEGVLGLFAGDGNGGGTPHPPRPSVRREDAGADRAPPQWENPMDANPDP